MMMPKYVFPLAVGALLGWSVWNVLETKGDARTSLDRAPAPERKASARGSKVKPEKALTGVSETSTVTVGSHLAGRVAQVFVGKPGDAVKAGDPLFRLEDWAVRAELEMKKADLRLAQQQLDWLPARRKEAATVLEKELDAGKATLAEVVDALARAKRVRRAIAPQELVKRKADVAVARSNVAKAEANLRLFAVTWKQDLAIARARVEQAQKAVEKVREDLKHLTVTAPLSGVVLEVNVRVGEMVASQPGMVLVRLGAVRKR
jgi:multidrug resistance efflux pump